MEIHESCTCGAELKVVHESWPEAIRFIQAWRCDHSHVDYGHGNGGGISGFSGSIPPTKREVKA